MRFDVVHRYAHGANYVPLYESYSITMVFSTQGNNQPFFFPSLQQYPRKAEAHAWLTGKCIFSL